MTIKDIYLVRLTRRARKQLKKLPLYIGIKLQAWIDEVGHRGLTTIRECKGYHDEPLQGNRAR